MDVEIVQDQLNASSYKNSNIIDSLLPAVVELKDLKEYLKTYNISNNYIEKIKPFKINMVDGEFTIINLLRVLPNRRLVLLAYDSHTLAKVVIKLYISSRKNQRDYQLALEGYKLLNAANLLTPQILYSAIDKFNELSYIICDYIEPNYSMCNEDSYYKLYIAAIAKLHKNNIYHSDLHVNNFLINNKKIYYLDTESLYAMNSKLVNNKGAENFAGFLAQLDVAYHDKWAIYSKHYLQCLIPNIANAKDTDEIINKISLKAKKYLGLNINHFLKKTNRDCTEFKIIKDTSIWCAIKREYNNLKYGITTDFLENPFKFIETYKSSNLKLGNTAHVYLVNYKGIPFVIKYYLPQGIFKQILNTVKTFFNKSRVNQSWYNGNLLEQFQIPTPKPIACIIIKKWFLVKHSFYVMRHSEDYRNIADVMETLDLENTNVATVLSDQISNLLTRFENLKLVHTDFKTVNIGISNDQLMVLDLDAMRRYKRNYFFKKAQLKDFNRILKCFTPNSKIYSLLESKLKNFGDQNA